MNFLYNLGVSIGHVVVEISTNLFITFDINVCKISENLKKHGNTMLRYL